MLQRLWNLYLMQFKLYLREPMAFFFSLAYPTLLLLLFGFIYGNDPAPEFWGRNFGTVDASVPAYAGIIIGTVALVGIPIDTASQRENGVLRRYRATPLRPIVYLVASIWMYLTVALVGMSILILAGKLIFGLRFTGSWLSVLGAFILSALAFYAFGYLISGLAASARAAQTIGMVIFFPMMFLSGAGLPIQILPTWLRQVSDYLPLTYVVRLIQGLWFNDSWQTLWFPVVILAGILVIGTLLAARFFRWE